MILQYNTSKRHISVYADGKFYDFVNGILEIDGNKERKALKQLLQNRNIEKIDADIVSDDDVTDIEFVETEKETEETENEVE